MMSILFAPNVAALYSAIDANDAARVTRALAHVSANEPLHTIGTPLTLAAQRGYKAIVEILLNAGARIDDCDRSHRTAVNLATRFGHGDVVELLIARGADLSLRDWHRFSPLRTAIDLCNEELAIMLIRAGAPVADDELCITASVSAAIVHAILARQIAICDVRDHLGRTACHVAAHRSTAPSGSLFRVLIDVAGVDVNALDHQGRTCAYICASNGHHDALRVCIEAGADIEVPFRDGGGLTPLHHACATGKYQSVLYLLAAGANLHTTNSRGQTACHFAAEFLLGSPATPRILYVLTAAGADIDAVDSSGQTPRARAHELGVAMPNEDELALVRREIVATQIGFVGKRALDVCVGLQSRDLDALQLCEILQHACGPVAAAIPFHRWWKIATTVKHFRREPVCRSDNQNDDRKDADSAV